jgi:hypothetical protein
MVLEPYTFIAIVSIMALATVTVGLVGLLVGVLMKLTLKSPLKLGLYGAYTGSIPGGLGGYTVASAVGTEPIVVAAIAFGSGLGGALLGAIAATAGAKLLTGRRRRRRRSRSPQG